MAYNGSHQTYDEVSIYQNGGSLGVSGMAYKNNFYTGALLNGGIAYGKSETGVKRDDWTVFNGALAAKAGYNWELGSRWQWKLQPELLAAYTLVYTPAYTNSSNVRIKTDPMNALTIQPQLRLSADLQKWGQPYAEVAFVGNFMDKTKYKADNVNLPEFSIKPFMRYGIGIRQSWAERWSGFLQADLTSGGVRSVGGQAGISYAL